MRYMTLLAAALFASLAGAALADCSHAGKQVPEGTRNGGLVCQNGQWVPG